MIDIVWRLLEQYLYVFVVFLWNFLYSISYSLARERIFVYRCRVFIYTQPHPLADDDTQVKMLHLRVRRYLDVNKSKKLQLFRRESVIKKLPRSPPRLSSIFSNNCDALEFDVFQSSASRRPTNGKALGNMISYAILTRKDNMAVPNYPYPITKVPRCASFVL